MIKSRECELHHALFFISTEIMVTLRGWYPSYLVLNNIHPSIKFTLEIQNEDRSLLFLNVIVSMQKTEWVQEPFCLLQAYTYWPLLELSIFAPSRNQVLNVQVFPTSCEIHPRPTVTQPSVKTNKLSETVLLLYVGPAPHKIDRILNIKVIKDLIWKSIN